MNGSSDAEFPTNGRLFGLDYGTKRVGVAVSNAEQSIASPLENYTRRTPDLDVAHIRQLIEEYSVVGLVVGLPVHISGDEGGKAREARRFGEWLRTSTGLPVCYWDERYTTTLAEDALLAAEMSKKKRKARLDKLAAQIMLQSFLDSRSSSD